MANRNPRPCSLVLTSFDAPGERVRRAATEGLHEAGFDVHRLNSDMSQGIPLAEALTKAIESVDLLVVDLSRMNPNVLYELGYAHGLRKPTVILLAADSHASLPHVLEGRAFLAYDPANLQSLRLPLRRFLSHLSWPEGR